MRGWFKTAVSVFLFLFWGCSARFTETERKQNPEEVKALRTDLQALADSFQAGRFEFVSWFSGKLRPRVTVFLSAEGAWLANTRGLAFFYQQKNDSALTEFELAVCMDSGYAEAWNNKGHLLLLSGRLDSAEISFRKSLLLNPDYDPARLNLEITGLFKSGELNWQDLGLMSIADSTRNPEEKVRIYTQLLNLAPFYVQVYNNLAVAEYQTGNINQAFQHLSAAVILDPTYAMAHNNLGYIYHEYGLYDDAIRHYLIAIRLRFNFFTALENLAFTYLTTGDVKNARLVINRVLEIEPGRKQALELDQQVKEAENQLTQQESR